jgi:hypothetical protein
MKLSSLIAMVILVLCVIFYLTARKKKSVEMKFGSTQEYIEWIADEAIKDAKEHNGKQLDYSIDSIQIVEKILGGMHDEYVKNPSSLSVPALANMYGAYIGEVIRRTEPGARWERDDAVAGEKSYPIIWGGGHSYPMGWCYKRILNGEEDNVWVKYRVLRDRRSQPSAPEGIQKPSGQ